MEDGLAYESGCRAMDENIGKAGDPRWRPWRINPFYARMGLGSFTKGPDGIIRKRDI